MHGLVASVDKSAYVAAKHGLVGLTKAVALETAKTGVTCNAICPGWVLTPLVQKQIDARARRDGLSEEQAKTALLGEKQPSGEFATPEQIGAICNQQPAADDQPDAGRLGGLVSADNAGEAIAVGNRECRKPEPGCSAKQLVGR